MTLQVTLEDAHAEACQALGEALVTQRLLAKEVQRLEAEVLRLKALLSTEHDSSLGSTSVEVNGKGSHAVST